MTAEIAAEIPGAAALIERFDAWPSFHDAEIVDLHLRRDGRSAMTIHTFRMTSEVSPSGHYRCDRHTLVTFVFGEIIASQLIDFNHQNVIFGLQITKYQDELEITLHPCYGLSGLIRAKDIAIQFVEGIPPGSVYSRA